MKKTDYINRNNIRKGVSVTISTAILLGSMITGCSSNETEQTTLWVDNVPTKETVLSEETATVVETTIPSITPTSSPSPTPTPIPVDPEIAALQQEFDEELALIPAHHIRFLKENGWTIEMTTKDLAAEYDYSSYICGITLYQEKIVYISATEYAIRRSTIHEVGHAIACQLGFVELTKEFKEIYEDEKDYFTDCTSAGDGHETYSVYEYFASVYQNMILDYDETQDEIPRTVAYIEKCLGKISPN